MKRRSILALIFGVVFALGSLQATEITTITTRDGIKIRVAHKKAHDRRGAVPLVLFQGRASFIEKHNELIKDLTELGFDVWTFDWRGQGGSDRLLDHAQKSHVEDFKHYMLDAHEVMTKVVRPKTNGPVVLFGQSLGGHMAVRYAYEYPADVRGIILAAPMMDVVTKPFPKFLARWIVAAMTHLGYGDVYAPGYGDFIPSKYKFENNTTTNDYNRWHRQQTLCEKNMHLTCGGPTNAWVYAAMQSMDLVNRPEVLANIKAPVLWATAGQDRVVDSHVDATLCQQMPHCHHVIYQESRHNIMMEVDTVRDAMLEDIKKFKQKVH